MRYPLFLLLLTSVSTPVFASESLATFDLADTTGSEVLVEGVSSTELPSSTFGNPQPENTPTEESESPISGGVDVMSDYMFFDATLSTPGPVVQPWVSVDLGGGFSANAWGSKNLDPNNNFGNELDLNVTYERSLGGGVTGRVVLGHYVLFGDVPDMQEITVEVEKGGVSLYASYNPWGGGLEDGYLIGATYEFDLAPRLSASTTLIYTGGFDSDAAIVASAGLTYDLGHGFSAKVNGYLPHRDDGVHERRAVFGIGWSF
jgi:Bacterial protein of unknown function (Gcw_chp)